MPFVEGRLRNQPLVVTFETECAHCARPMEIVIDSELGYRVPEGSEPLIVRPHVDFARLEDPSIIDVF